MRRSFIIGVIVMGAVAVWAQPYKDATLSAEARAKDLLGRLPLTFYSSTDQLPDYESYLMKGALIAI